MANLRFRPRSERRNWPGRLRQRPTTGNCNMVVLLANLVFLAVGRCRNHLANLRSSSTSSNIPNLELEFRRYLSEFQRCNYFRFSRPYRYFRLSVAVILRPTCQYYLHLHIPQICRLNFNCTFHSLRDKVFPVSATISDCRSLLESLRYTSCEFAMVECRRFAVGILMIYVIFSEILLLPVSWLPSWISGEYRRPTKSEVLTLESLTPKTWV